MISKLSRIANRLWEFTYSHVYWFIYDIRYSLLCRDKDDLLNRLLVAGHIIEKGISMPNRRYGFGYSTIRLVIDFANKCIDKYGVSNNQLQYAIDDLEEYYKIHKEANYKLPDDITKNIEALLKHKKVESVNCISISKTDFFCDYKDFKDFAHSRHTSRWFSGDIVSNEVILEAIELAQTAPSACNRQSIRVKVLSGEVKNAVVSLQNGNRGFGDNISHLILLTSNRNSWDENFRTSAYLDGGIFTMNLLYALHYYKICACTLNAHLSPNAINKLRKITGINKSEVPIVFIAIGTPTEEMVIAKSRRIATKDIVTFI